MGSSRKWDSNRFIEEVGSKIGVATQDRTRRQGLYFDAVRWSHPAHETRTESLEQHFIALMLSPKTAFSCRVNDGASQRHEMRRGAVSFIPAERPADWIIEAPMTVLNVFVARGFADIVGEETPFTVEDVLSGPDILAQHDVQAERLALILNDEMIAGGGHNKLFTEHVLAALWMRLCSLQKGISDAAPMAGPSHVLPHRRLKIVIDFMQAHLQENLGLEELARLAGLSVFHFCRCFRSATGLPPAQYLRQLRIEKARELLAQNALSLSEIALVTGFASQSHFTQAFRTALGTTPGRYRNEMLVLS